MAASDGADPRIYVVSLRRAKARRKAVAEQLAGRGLNFVFVDAVDARQVDEDWLSSQVDAEAVLRNFGRTLGKAEIGCALSHRLVYEAIRDNGECGAIVLEDDAILPPEFDEVVAHFRSAGPALSDRWAVYHLYALASVYAGIVVFRRRRATPIGDNVRFARNVGWLSPNLWGTCGYYITRHAAEAILASPRVETVADHWSLWAKRAKGQMYVSVPATVFHPPDGRDSEIENTRQPLLAKGRSVLARRTRYLYLGVKARIVRWFVRPVAERVL